jgi:RNA polymerase sigma factor (TIGR02999 family)
MNEVTRILNAVESGDTNAAAELLPLVYDELRQLAASRLASEIPGQTLQPTALVHEAYLRLVGPISEMRWDSRGHFFAAAAEAMRRILVDIARRKQGQKHGGQLHRRELDVEHPADAGNFERLIELDDALTQLAVIDARAAEVVKLRYFAGLTIAEVAESLGITSRTADADWAYARAWLVTALRDDI